MKWHERRCIRIFCSVQDKGCRTEAAWRTLDQAIMAGLGGVADALLGLRRLSHHFSEATFGSMSLNKQLASKQRGPRQ